MSDGSAARLFATINVLEDVQAEVNRQFELWGEQNHPDQHDASQAGHWAIAAEMWKRINAERVADNSLSWDGIALEEVFEALGEEDRSNLETECVQAAAVFVTWVLAQRRRRARELTGNPELKHDVRCSQVDGRCVGYHCAVCGEPSSMLGHAQCTTLPASDEATELHGASDPTATVGSITEENGT